MLTRALHLARRQPRPAALLPVRPTAVANMSTGPTVPAYLLHAPFLTLEHPDTADRPPTPSSLLQRTLPPAPLYYLHPAPPTPPGSAPPVLSLAPTPPVKGRASTVYRATTPSGAKVVVKYGHDLLAAAREADEVFVNLPGGGGLPIPTFWGIFEGSVEPDQPKSLVMVLEDCGEPIEGGFESLSKDERCVQLPLLIFTEQQLTLLSLQAQALRRAGRVPQHPLPARLLLPLLRRRPAPPALVVERQRRRAQAHHRRLLAGRVAPVPRAARVQGARRG